MTLFNLILASLILGGILIVLGVVGSFVRISQNDGGLLIAGAILFAAGLISAGLIRRSSH